MGDAFLEHLVGRQPNRVNEALILQELVHLGRGEGRMHEAVDRHLERVAKRGEADRRNGFYRRYLLTELGRIELCVPRTRRFGSFKVVRAYARRAGHIDRMILACFVLGLSTRKVSKALLPVLGVPVSASTVSRVAKTLDAAVASLSSITSPRISMALRERAAEAFCISKPSCFTVLGLPPGLPDFPFSNLAT